MKDLFWPLYQSRYSSRIFVQTTSIQCMYLLHTTCSLTLETEPIDVTPNDFIQHALRLHILSFFPQPIVVTCEALPDISNGGVSLSGTQFASVATYSCDVGYRLEGEMERTCLSNGSWSDTTPLCQGLLVIKSTSNQGRMNYLV